MSTLTTQDTLYDALQHHFGFDQFKGDQEAIIRNLLDGNDTFVIMPTGGGKSLCYQLPALMFPGTAIIISPLINFEVSQAGFGLYVKYLMAGFLAIFAITMMIQFVSYMFEAVADWRGEPGAREATGSSAH